MYLQLFFIFAKYLVFAKNIIENSMPKLVKIEFSKL